MGKESMIQRKTWSCLLIGFGLQIVIGVAMSIVQAFTLISGFHSTSIEAKAIPVICLVGIPFIWQ